MDFSNFVLPDGADGVITLEDGGSVFVSLDVIIEYKTKKVFCLQLFGDRWPDGDQLMALCGLKEKTGWVKVNRYPDRFHYCEIEFDPNW